MDLRQTTLILIPQEELNLLKSTQQEILNLLKSRQPNKADVIIKNIPAKDFMAAVNIKRTKFDELVKTNKIRIIRKQRKIYVPVSEIDRYFNDPTA
jgi:hypothetical protein